MRLQELARTYLCEALRQCPVIRAFTTTNRLMTLDCLDDGVWRQGLFLQSRKPWNALSNLKSIFYFSNMLSRFETLWESYPTTREAQFKAKYTSNSLEKRIENPLLFSTHPHTPLVLGRTVSGYNQLDSSFSRIIKWLESFSLRPERGKAPTRRPFRPREALRWHARTDKGKKTALFFHKRKILRAIRK